MNPRSLIPNSPEVELICLRQKAGAVQVELRANRPSSLCPYCGRRSSRVHSRYYRTIADLPWEGIPVQILLEARKFFCVDERCSRRIFTEQLPGTVSRYARRSFRSSESLSFITLALGGRVGARLARKLGLLASGSTLLRELRKGSHCFPPAAPRVLGIGEWAWEKGRRYGTILCDLEQGRVIDLLPDRSTETVADWLHHHPSVEVVSRDRAGSFGAAIAKGAPAAAQVADRWHLLNNLFETLTRSLERHRHLMREVRDLLEPQSELAVPHSIPERQPTEAHKRKEQSRERRLERYEAMKWLVDGGMNYSEASRHLGIPLRAVQRWVACGVFPERKERKFPSNVDEFSEHLDRRYREGCRNATQLWREIKQLGFSGKACSVWYWLRRRFGFVREVSDSPTREQSPSYLTATRRMADVESESLEAQVSSGTL